MKKNKDNSNNNAKVYKINMTLVDRKAPEPTRMVGQSGGDSDLQDIDEKAIQISSENPLMLKNKHLGTALVNNYK